LEPFGVLGFEMVLGFGPGEVDKKLPTTSFGPFMTTEDGLVEPDRSPDHPLNV
jgi:hypothetical protein